MSRLVLVRHGQATFRPGGGEGYDQLSAIGEMQSMALGEYWARTGVRFDWAIRGPAKRHVRTGELALAAETTEMADFDEYPAFEVMRRALPGLVNRSGEIGAMEKEYRRQSEPAEVAKAFERLFQRVLRMWARGEVEAAGVETWSEFIERVRRGLERVRREAGPNRRVVVFTSGGPVAVAMREALGLKRGKDDGIELGIAEREL